MTKAKISEYDAVASNNTDVNGVNIAEGCPPSGMNNMGREIMAALKRFQVGSDGDGVTVGGNLVVSGSSTVNTFTAGPVSATTLNTSGAVVFNDSGADVDFRVEGDTDANLLFVDASADAVGIGTNTPGARLDVVAAASNVLKVTNDSTSGGELYAALFSNQTTNQGGLVINTGASYFGLAALSTTPLAFITNGNERMRIDSSGNLLVGKTAKNFAVAGFQVEQSSGETAATRTSGTPLVVNRLTTDGELIGLYKDGTAFGSIGRSGNLYIDAPSQGSLAIGGTILYNWDSNQFFPQNDNARDLGFLTLRWDDVYATNGTIQTSDRNEKQDIEELTEAETRVAVAAKGLLRKYRWKSAVAEKGDDARIHFGIIAQDLQAAFEAEGLDAGRYAMFIKGEWWEKERVIPAVEAQEAVYETQTDEEGNETQVLVSEAVEAQPERIEIDTFETEEEAGEGAVRKERMGIRYNELLAFIIAAL